MNVFPNSVFQLIVENFKN